MYVLKSAMVSSADVPDPADKNDVPVFEACNGASEQPQTVIYLDSRALTRDCL
jgi:hypothetical protein